MPGGEINISVDEDFGIVMVGPVTRIAEGRLANEMFE
jgi:diaminopimelate epimerase